MSISPSADPAQPVVPRVGASIAVFREGEVLLIRRGKRPFEGCWSLPGGEVMAGEVVADAAQRELLEETAVRAEDLTLSDVLSAIEQSPAGAIASHYVIVVYAGRWNSGEAFAGEDASEARWFSADSETPSPATPGLWSAVRKARRVLETIHR